MLTKQVAFSTGTTGYINLCRRAKYEVEERMYIILARLTSEIQTHSTNSRSY